MRRSCSDSPLTASQLDKVFGSDKGLQQLGWTDGCNARIELNDLQLTKVWRAQRCEVAPSALALSPSLLCSGGEPDLWCALDAGLLHCRLQVW